MSEGPQVVFGVLSSYDGAAFAGDSQAAEGS